MAGFVRDTHARIRVTRGGAQQARQLIADGIAPLATLDAIHVKTGLEIEADAFATDDEQLARAAARHGLEVITFSSPP